MLELVGRGLSDRQIASSLGLSHETARSYVKTVRRKLGSNNRLAAAVWSWRQQAGGSSLPHLRGGISPTVRPELAADCSKFGRHRMMTTSARTATWSDQQPPASMTVSGKSIKKLSVLLPARLHQLAKRQALLNDQTLTELIISLLINHLEAAEQEQAQSEHLASGLANHRYPPPAGGGAGRHSSIVTLLMRLPFLSASTTSMLSVWPKTVCWPSRWGWGPWHRKN